AGGNDQARLYDSVGDDWFYGKSTESWLSGTGFCNVAWGFDRVDAYANAGGNDRARLYDSAGDDSFYGKATESWLSGDGFSNVAWGFDRVDGYASGGYDQAKFYDSAGNDLFYGDYVTSSLTGTGFANYSHGFDRIDAFARAGGTDRAKITGVLAADSVFGRDSYLDWVNHHLELFDFITATAADGQSPHADVVDIDYVFDMLGTWI
ncbi:MAG: hypothetical protein GXX96_37500, partial [Planctomycetaceae bacterium]|nr:hypothetical protein [Planctomycetaceae bacterium]